MADTKEYELDEEYVESIARRQAMINRYAEREDRNCYLRELVRRDLSVYVTNILQEQGMEENETIENIDLDGEKIVTKSN